MVFSFIPHFLHCMALVVASMPHRLKIIIAIATADATVSPPMTARTVLITSIILALLVHLRAAVYAILPPLFGVGIRHFFSAV